MENLSTSTTEHQHSTYQLLIESEEKERTAFESIAYFLLVAATCAAMWQFSHQPVTFTSVDPVATQNVAPLG